MPKKGRPPIQDKMAGRVRVNKHSKPIRGGARHELAFDGGSAERGLGSHASGGGGIFIRPFPMEQAGYLVALAVVLPIFTMGRRAVKRVRAMPGSKAR